MPARVVRRRASHARGGQAKLGGTQKAVWKGSRAIVRGGDALGEMRMRQERKAMVESVAALVVVVLRMRCSG